MADKETLILGIETSCDETAAAVVRGGREVLSNVIASQIDVHRVFGGVVPEIASRCHLEAINGVVKEALDIAGIRDKDIDAIAVTKGPGLLGAILIGLATAKAMAYVLDKPLIGVHHIFGHICAGVIEHPELEPPFVALVVSGGHTSLVDVGQGSLLSETALPATAARPQKPSHLAVLGSTRDDAAGEAYDKVARVLKLGYPGGPFIDAAAKNGDPGAVTFKRAMLEDGSLDFSFSGLKTGVLNYINSRKQANLPINENDIAASFQEAVIDVLAAKTGMALEKTGYDRLALAGGVAANTALRARLQKDCDNAGILLCIPSPVYCTDNAAMIACAGHYMYKAGMRDSLDLDAFATIPLC